MDLHANADLLQTCSDELERLALEEVHKRRPALGGVSALVLPVGRGELAIEMARLGCRVTGCDNNAFEQELRGRALSAGKADAISFVVGSLEALPTDLGGPYDIIYLRRGLCTLPYAAARQALKQLIPRLRIGGKLYLSVLGLHSELGERYPGSDQVIEDRLCNLDPGMATKYGIHQPVCLYTERNLFMLLLETGASVLRTFTTTHGSVKGVAVRV